MTDKVRVKRESRAIRKVRYHAMLKLRNSHVGYYNLTPRERGLVDTLYNLLAEDAGLKQETKDD